MLQFVRLCVLGALLLAQASGVAQPPASPPPPPPTQQPQQPPPRFRTETNLVRVDVYATKDGVALQDLSAADFEVYEDNAPQKIDSFEHIVVRTGGPQEERSEPTSVTAANQLAADPRRRVFVLFLDTEHVEIAAAYNIKEPLVDLLTRIMGPDDLVGVMTPKMSPSEITFGRRTQVIEEGLRKFVEWGHRNSPFAELDETETMYSQCFPPTQTMEGFPSELARKMIVRRRERLVLDSLQDLIRHMGAIREGRTAVITVSDGWTLFAPDPSMTLLRTTSHGGQADPIPGTPPPVGVGPGGMMTTHINNDPTNPSDRTECERDRAELSMVDHAKVFQDLFGEANRANVSFYPIDPRGLPTFNLPVSKDPRVVQTAYFQQIHQIESLQEIALETDGIALVNSNDLTKQMRRMADDLTSYYLIGYYSSNSKLDGKFRAIKVRSTRPGIEIRARRGYSAATPEEVAKARKAAEAVVPEAKVAVTRALGTIETDARAAGRKTTRAPGDPVVLHRGPSTGNQIQPADGRIFPRSERIRLETESTPGAPGWTGAVLDRAGTRTAIPVVAGERTDAATGQRWLTADITLAPLGPGDYVVELSTVTGTATQKSLVAIRVTQ